MSDFDRPTGDEPLLLALARGRTVRDAANEAGISEATAWRRLRDQSFVRRLISIRLELSAAATTAGLRG